LLLNDVVSNAGPLIALARVNRLPILQNLYNRLLMAVAVQREVTGKADLPGSTEIDAAKWIEVVEVTNRVAVHLLRDRLDAGESEAISLVIAMNADFLLIDEARGRKVARMQNLAHTGTIGILVLAKRRQLIPSITPILEELSVAGFRMDDAIRKKAQQLAGEV
jgi:predicted nucleic acid-binding protein